VDKIRGYDFFWRNHKLPLAPLPPGSPYDPNFYGGIDELLPNDIPEIVDGVPCPDHGELWTLPLEWRWDARRLELRGTLPLFGLEYARAMTLRIDSPCLDVTYRITNTIDQPRHFLWKLHAALSIEPGDVIECPARHGQVVDPAWSRFRTLTPFAWPRLEGQPANVVPPPDGSVDFFYLFDLASGRVAWHRPRNGLQFTYQFDLKVFPYTWLFASYGGFDGHYTAILEPCTAMPISVREAAAKKQCSLLDPGQSLETLVSIWAGPPGTEPTPPP
jgi:hypothetical protein